LPIRRLFIIDFDRQEALHEINQAISDYVNEREWVTIKELSTPPLPRVFAAEMREALERMPRPVDIPSPTWPTRSVLK
jgi:hypothetical protein